METTAQTVLVALDLGPGSERVAEYASALARKLGARVVALHVVVGLEDILEFEFPYVNYEEDFVDLNEKARVSLERFVAEHMPGTSGVKVRIADGKAAKEILLVAREEAADLLVLGTHETSRLERAIYGSPTQQVARRTPIPLLLVPTRTPDAG